jgi:hypothetical protein
VCTITWTDYFGIEHGALFARQTRESGYTAASGGNHLLILEMSDGLFE